MSNLELYRGAGELETFRAETTKTGTINGVPYVDKRGKLFEAGVHRGKVYTEADLDRVVQQFTKPKAEDKWTVPVYEDHEDKQRRMVGSVRSVERIGRELHGTLRFNKQENVDNVMCGLFSKLSPAIWYKLMKLKEVSVTPEPHFDDTELFHQQQTEEANMGEGTQTTQQAAGTPAAPTQQVTLSKDDLASFAANAVKQANDAWEERFTKQQSDFDAFKAQAEKDRKELETLRAARVDASASTQVELFRAQGKTTGKPMIEAETAFVKTLNPEQLEAYKKVKEAQPAIVDLNRYGINPAEKPHDAEPTPEEFSKQVDDLVERYGPNAGKKTEE